MKKETEKLKENMKKERMFTASEEKKAHKEARDYEDRYFTN